MVETTVEAAGAVPRVGARTATAPFRFTGKASEWFGIWIVNILLTIVTLGIYSAWAKVRTKRYFLGNTHLDGHTFGYHADPKKILLGRIIAIAVLVALQLVGSLHPLAALVVLPLYALLLPWAIVRGFSFNANMTSYRNLRFGFEGRKREAFMAFFGWPILGFLAIGAVVGVCVAAGLLPSQEGVAPEPAGILVTFAIVLVVAALFVPLTSRAYARLLGRHRYGTAPFACDPPLSRYAKALGLAAAIGVAGFVLLAVIGFGIIGIGAASRADPSQLGILLFVPAVLSYILIFVGPVVYAALSRNAFFDHLHLEGGHRFTSTLSPLRYAWIVISNVVVSVLTLGLMVPWAQIRLARYKAEHTAMLPAGPLDGFVAGERDRTGVAQGEFLDLDGGIDIGF